jgi:hypothetical protein
MEKPYRDLTGLLPHQAPSCRLIEERYLLKKRTGNDGKKLSLFVIALALSVSWSAILQSTNHQAASLDPNANAAQATNAAFRDGLYLGKLAAERGSESHVATGRWATNQDRISFAAGYQQGCDTLIATRAVVNQVDPAE